MSEQPVEPIPYASVRDPGQKAASPWPLIVLVVVAMGMIVLGGCFCVGLLLLVQPSLIASVPTSSRMDDGQALFGIFLGFLATLCFLFGIALAFGLTRKLLRRI